MKRFCLLIMSLALVGLAQAQWLVWSGDTIPTDKVGMSFDISEGSPGTTFTQEIVDDSDLAGNKILKYYQLGGKTMYRTQLPASVTDFTIVARVKGWGDETVKRAFDIQWRCGAVGLRDELQINPKDSTLKLSKTGVTEKVDADFNQWHTFRIAVMGADVKVYLDEATTPAITGTMTSTTTDNYIKVGDGSGDDVGGYADFMLFDYSGAYAPGEGTAIPAGLIPATGSGLPGEGKTVLYLTKHTMLPDGITYSEQGNVEVLEAAGFTVVLPDYNDYKSLGIAQMKALAAADVIVLGRDVSSGDFEAEADADDWFWEKTQTPIVLLSNYLARSNRLKWFPTSALINVSRYGAAEGTVSNTSDAAFAGVTLSGSTFTVLNDYLGMMDVPELDSINGEVLISLSNGHDGYVTNNQAYQITDTLDLSMKNGQPLMVRFEPGMPMYKGEADGFMAAVPQGWRTYLASGNDMDYDTVAANRLYAFDVYTAEMKKVFVNEVANLIGKTVPALASDASLSALTTTVGSLSPAFAAGVMNYSIEVPEGTTSIAIGATATDAMAMVVGAGDYSMVPDTVMISVIAQDGTIMDYAVELKSATASGAGKTVIYITKNTVPSGDSIGTEQKYIDALEAAGFTVVVGAYSSYASLTEVEMQSLTDADLIVLGRDVSSGDFNATSNADDWFWEKVQTPTILLSNYLARANRLKWFPTNGLITVGRFGTLTGSVTNPSDAAFAGVSLTSNKLPYLTDYLGMMDVATLDSINGEILISLVDGPEAYGTSNTAYEIKDTLDLATKTGQPLMVRFAPSEPMFKGEAEGVMSVIPLGWRTYMASGNDSDFDTIANDRKYAFDVFSAEMLRVFVNEAVNLTTLPVPQLSADASLSGITATVGEFNVAFDAATTTYQLVLPEGSTTVGISATATDAVATVTGTGDFTTFPTDVVISVKAEDGSVMEYTVSISVATGVTAIADAAEVTVMPNPFSDQVIISAELASEVTLVIYDVVGNAVYTAKQAAGTQEFVVSGAGLAAGTYSYTLSTSGSVMSGRIVKF